MPNTVILAVLVAAAGCVDPQPHGRVVDPAAEAEPMLVRSVPSATERVSIVPLNRGESVCDLLPASGPCSAACDPDALSQYLVIGACVTYFCELSDGQSFQVGGCR